MKYWEIIADNLSKAGWSWGCVSTIDHVRSEARHVQRRKVAQLEKKVEALTAGLQKVTSQA